jgi:Fe-S cluster assembly protein SufD
MEAQALPVETAFAPDFRAAADRDPSWLANRRRSARERFEALGFPTRKTEAWRFTSVRPILEIPWARAAGTEEPRFAVRPQALPRGVRIRRLREALAEAEPLLGRIASFQDKAFTALNTALFEDGLLVEIARGAVVEEPIELLFEAPAAGRPEVSYPRLLVVAGEHSQATIVETWAGRRGLPRLTCAVTEIAVGDGAVLAHVKVQREEATAFHIQAIAARQGRASRFASHNVALGAALARTDLDVLLAEEGAECEADGLYVIGDSQHCDNHTTIDHARSHGTSRELYKGILDGKARGVFHGMILVRPGAQKSDAIQTNKNLLLSREALVDSTPALTIEADDVKCKHGSTTGQLDPLALFYLRSRGLDEGEARALLVRAFASELVAKIPAAGAREAVEAALSARLPLSTEAP